MKFSILLFLLLFTIIPADRIQVWQTKKKEDSTDMYVENIQYEDKNKLDHNSLYIFLEENENDRINMIYWSGTQTHLYMKIELARCFGETLGKTLISLNANIGCVRRGPSTTNIDNFRDLLLSADVSKKTPRLYRVTAHNIRQVQLNCDLINKNDSYVLNDGLSLTIYYSPKCETKREIADSFASYIEQVEYDINPESPSYNERNSETTLQKFCNKILNVLQDNSKSKKNSIQKCHKRNSKVVKKLSEDEIAAIRDCVDLESNKKEIFAYLRNNMVLTETDFLRNDRISDTATASSSKVPTHTQHKKKNSKAAKGKTISQETRNISFLESVLEVTTTSNVADSRDTKYENLIPIFLGSEECAPKTQPPIIDTLKTTCLYMLKDLGNNELFIYIGRNSDVGHIPVVLKAAEIDIYENPSVKLTIVFEGNTIPIPFMLHIESEMRKILNDENDLN